MIMKHEEETNCNMLHITLLKTCIKERNIMRNFIMDIKLFRSFNYV